MGTNTTRKNKFFTPIPRFMSGGGSSLTKGTSPYFYGVVTYVNPETRAIQYDVLEDNISSGRIGEAIPAYKDNITLPQLNDVVPLFNGPTADSGLLSEQYSKTVYYLDPISNLGDLAENGLVRTTIFSPLPPEVNPDTKNYLTSDIGFAVISNGERVDLAPQAVGGYKITTVNGLDLVKLKSTGDEVQVPKYVITTPNNNVSNNMAIVFGGMHYATPSWMEKQVPESYKSNKVFLFVDSYRTNTKLNEVLTYKGKNFPGYNITSVSGFSLGGYEAWNAIANNYNFIGLMDPSTNSNNVNIYTTYKGKNQAPSNVVMAYNINTWGGIPSIKANLQKVAPLMGPYAKSLRLSHEEIPKWFFENYGGRL